MILINLLPHREMARTRARQAFNVSLVGSLVAGAVIAGAVYLWYQSQIEQQQARNTFLTSEIGKLDEQIKEVATLQDEIAALKARQEAVENLQADRNMPVHLLNEAVRQLPDGMYLTKIKQDNQNVLIEGVAQSNERVSELLRNLARGSDWVTKPELIEIVAKSLALSPREQRRVYNFTIRVKLQRASDAQAAASAASGPTGMIFVPSGTALTAITPKPALQARQPAQRAPHKTTSLRISGHLSSPHVVLHAGTTVRPLHSRSALRCCPSAQSASGPGRPPAPPAHP